jgi:hypothetical protein
MLIRENRILILLALTNMDSNESYEKKCLKDACEREREA